VGKFLAKIDEKIELNKKINENLHACYEPCAA